MLKTRCRASRNISTEKLSYMADFVGDRVISAAREQIFLLSCLLDENEEKYAKIKENANGIILLQNEFRDYCDIIANKNEINLKKLSVKSALLDIKQKALSYAVRKNVGIDLSIQDENSIIAVDGMKFYYSLFYILKNSFENSQSGDKIRISVSNTKKYVKIKISDSGAGMDKETLEHCCEPFFSTTDGLGIGLTIAKNNVEAMGGNFDIKSEKGKGTAVFVSVLEADYAEKKNVSEIKDFTGDPEAIDEAAKMIFSSL